MISKQVGLSHSGLPEKHDLLEIFTKSDAESTGYYLKFDFKTIRSHLLKEQERRKKGLAPKLYLERLLQEAVFVEQDRQRVLQQHGTKALMSGVLNEAYKRLVDWEIVESYLQNVVPLPFRPDFTFGREIEKKFEEEDYRVVPLSLQIGGKRNDIYRPYTNNIFSQGGLHRPKYFPLRRGNKRFGFVWVCINDERRVLKDQSLRGLLIKKFGFSIANRSYLEPFFARTVFNRRITGEIIIQHPNLLPNAARSDFENNSTRQEFLELLPLFIKKLSDWANVLQEEDKAREVLKEVTERLTDILTALPADRRDKDKMLQYNVEIAQQERSLEVHKKTLAGLADVQQQRNQVMKLLKECKTFVRDALSRSARARERLERDVTNAIQAEAGQLPSAVTGQKSESPGSLTSILEDAGLQLSSDLRAALEIFDSQCLREHLDDSSYATILKELKDILEERF
ncbi:MAG TPA: hypothetical protein VJ044_00045 [Candidatus Hodarchaeales archaeon]|nr:hypothetical protein [Candidatus Hodarchaeales archaeon]